MSLQVHYDGWSQQFDVWCDGDNSDLHPVGWCQRTGHLLEPPPGVDRDRDGDRDRDRQTGGRGHGYSRRLLSVCETGSSPVSSPSQGVCPTPGCRGVGHIKGARYTGHHRWGPSHLSRCGCCWTGSSQGSRLSRLSRSAFGCPYSDINMRKEVVLPDRLGGERTITLVPVSVCSHGNQPDR